MDANVNDLPPRALAVRQPWAWAIFHAGKDIENREWSSDNKKRLLAFRGRVAIHASKSITSDEYIEARDFMRERGVRCPSPTDPMLLRGGIIGSVEIVDVIKESDNPWFMGPYGLVLRNAVTCEFVPSNGLLGFYPWKPADNWAPPPVAKWMRTLRLSYTH